MKQSSYTVQWDERGVSKGWKKDEKPREQVNEGRPRDASLKGIFL
jgi:hypothetical protein